MRRLSLNIGFNFVFFLICILVAEGQTNPVDSLKLVLGRELSDSQRVEVLNRLSFTMDRVNPDSAYLYAMQALELSRVTGNRVGEASSQNSLGNIQYAQGNFDSALFYYNQFLSVAKTEDSLLMARAYNNLGIVSVNQAKWDQALYYYMSSLEIQESRNSPTIGILYNNLGLLHKTLGNYRQSMMFYQKALNIKNARSPKFNLATTNLNLAELKDELKDYESVAIHLKAALELYESLGDKKGISYTYQNMGKNLFKQDSLEMAEIQFKKSLEMIGSMGNRMGVIDNLLAIGDIKLKQRLIDSSSYYFSRALALSEEVGAPFHGASAQLGLASGLFERQDFNQSLKWAMKAYQAFDSLGVKKDLSLVTDLLSRIYAAREVYDHAYKYQGLSTAYRDSLVDENEMKEIARIEFNQELSKVNRANTDLQERNLILGSTIDENTRVLESQRRILLVQTAIIVIVGISLLVIFVLFRQVKKAKNTSERLLTEILDKNKLIEQQSREIAQVNLEISELNQSLEKRIEERTERIKRQSEQLTEYAFALSHEIRAPLTNLVGLLNLNREVSERLSKEEKNQVETSTMAAIQKLDKVVRKVAHMGKYEAQHRERAKFKK